MRAIIFSLLVIASSIASADVKVMVEFNGNEHEIVGAYDLPENNFKSHNRGVSKHASPNQMVVTYMNGDIEQQVLMSDPRIIRAPIPSAGGAHESVVVSNSGSYIITLTGSDVKLESLSVKLPKQKGIPEVEIKLKDARTK